MKHRHRVQFVDDDAPVGVFSPTSGRWIRGHGEPPQYVEVGRFEAEDEAQSWHGTNHVDAKGTIFPVEQQRSYPNLPVQRKAGTPAHRRLADTECARWVDPPRFLDVVKIDERRS